MKINLTPLEVVLISLISLTIYLLTKYQKQMQHCWREWWKRHRAARKLHPREPKDCPQCALGVYWLPGGPQREVVPWSQVKNRAGRPKSSNTEGHACLEVDCRYFGITDPAVHALVFDGKRGIEHDIQQLRCQACDRRRTSRLATPMYQIKTPLGRVAMVMTALSEGVDLSAASRIFGHHPNTLSRWLVRTGEHSARLHSQLFHQALESGHVQLDELVTKVRQGSQRIWVWTAICAQSKLILGLHLGGRTMGDACQLIHQLSERLRAGVFPVFTSDGLNHYFYALTAHFGVWHRPPRARKQHWFPDPRLLYAQLFKARSGYRVKFLFSRIRLGTRDIIRTLLQNLDLSGTIQTAFIERSNLTLRELVAPLSRRTWSLAYDTFHLERHLWWGLAYYHLVRPHLSLRLTIRGPSRYRHRTPAMAAGLTHRCWSVADLLLVPIPEGVRLNPFPVA